MIAAEGEQKSSKALKDASDIISSSPAALQLRYLQVSRASLKKMMVKKPFTRQDSQLNLSGEKLDDHLSASDGARWRFYR